MTTKPDEKIKSSSLPWLFLTPRIIFNTPFNTFLHVLYKNCSKMEKKILLHQMMTTWKHIPLRHSGNHDMNERPFVLENSNYYLG